jgi:hypothetical protein
MNCKEIAENYAQAAEIVRIEERGKTRLFIIICILGFALILESAYIVYDRKKDSEFMIESTEIVQDGQGSNTYIDGVGVFHVAESQENEK